jgi:hypothetical protein
VPTDAAENEHCDPGDHQWFTAARYYFTAARLIAGIPLMLAGAAGAIWMLIRRACPVVTTIN